MEALYGAEPQFGAPNSIFLACGAGTFHKKIVSDSWPASVHRLGERKHDVVVALAVAQVSAEMLPAALRASGDAAFQLVVSMSRRALLANVVVAAAADSSLVVNEPVCDLRAAPGSEEGFLDLASSRDRLLLFYRRPDGVTSLYAFPASAVLTLHTVADLARYAVLDLGADTVPAALSFKGDAAACLLSQALGSLLPANGELPRKKLRKNRHQIVLYLRFGLTATTVKAVVLAPAVGAQGNFTALSCEENTICIGDGLGALHWWTLPELDSGAEFDLSGAAVKLDELPTVSPAHKIRVHWHNAALSSLKLWAGMTFSGGEQSRLVCWNFESGQQRVRNWHVADGSIVRIQVPPAGVDRSSHVLVVTSTNKLFLIDTSKINQNTWQPIVIGPVMPVIYPAKLSELQLLSRIDETVTLFDFLAMNDGRTTAFAGFGGGHFQLTVSTFHRFAGRLCAHDGDLRLQRIVGTQTLPADESNQERTVSEVEGAPFARKTLRTYKKHMWCRADRPGQMTSSPMYLGVHAISAAAAFPERDLLVLATTLGADPDRIHLLELWRFKAPGGALESAALEPLVKSAVPSAIVALESGPSGQLVVALENGQVHFSVVDENNDFPTLRVLRREDLGKVLTLKEWRTAALREEVLAKYF